MRTLPIVLLLSLVAAGVGHGQRGGRVVPTSRGMPSGRAATPRRSFTAKALDELNPARVVLDQRKALELDAGEQARLDTAAKWLDARIATHMKRADSIEKVMSAAAGLMRAGASGAPTAPGAKVDSARQAKQDALVEHAQSARRDLVSLLIEIKTDFDSTATRSTALVSDARRPKVADVVAVTMEDVSALLRQAEGGG
jgi:hypothetical protein